MQPGVVLEMVGGPCDGRTLEIARDRYDIVVPVRSLGPLDVGVRDAASDGCQAITMATYTRAQFAVRGPAIERLVYAPLLQAMRRPRKVQEERDRQGDNPEDPWHT